MTGATSRRFAWNCSLIGLASGLFAVAAVAPLGRSAVGWVALGWSITALIGVAGAVWSERVHGLPDSKFLAAVGTCMLARLVAAAAGAWGAARQGMGAVWPYLAGLGVGYLPLQVYELRWFLRRAGS